MIQPQVPLRLPCYDFAPVAGRVIGPCLRPPKGPVSSGTSDAADFRGVTGGVCKARERIHGDIADTPLLPIPASWGRVAAPNPHLALVSGFAPPFGVASHCPGHCSAGVAPGI